MPTHTSTHTDDLISVAMDPSDRRRGLDKTIGDSRFRSLQPTDQAIVGWRAMRPWWQWCERCELGTEASTQATNLMQRRAPAQLVPARIVEIKAATTTELSGSCVQIPGAAIADRTHEVWTKAVVRNCNAIDLNHHLVAAIDSQEHTTIVGAHVSDERRGWMRPLQQRRGTVDQSAAVMQIEDVDGRTCLNQKAPAGPLVGFFVPTRCGCSGHHPVKTSMTYRTA